MNLPSQEVSFYYDLHRSYYTAARELFAVSKSFAKEAIERRFGNYPGADIYSCNARDTWLNALDFLKKANKAKDTLRAFNLVSGISKQNILYG